MLHPSPQPETLSSTPTPEPSRWWLLALPLLFIAVRCIYAPLMELSGDEAYYWSWSRHPAGGYFDHPPMAAWLIHLSTGVLGNTEFAVRLPAILLSAGIVGMALAAMSLLTRSFRHLFTLELLLLSFPMLHVFAAVITPDTPAAFFTAAAIAAGLFCLRHPEGFCCYLLLGIAGGLAMLSKYTAIFPVTAILAVLCLRDWRRLPRIILTILVASLVVSPMLLWNFQHDWISFRFQLHHGTGSDDRSWRLNLLDYLGSQLLVATPILAPLMVIQAVKTFRKGDASRRLLATVGLVPLLMFGLSSLRHKVEANWASLAWVPLLILLALQVPDGTPRFRRLLRDGLFLALGFVLILHMPPALLARISPRSPAGAVGGWKLLANQIHSFTAGRPLLCTKYQDAALLEFYLPNQPFVSLLREPGSRPTQADVEPHAPPGGEFVLITDNGNMLPGTSHTLFSGSQSLDVDVVACQNIQINLDDLQRRARLAVTCQPGARTGDAPPVPR